MQPLIRIEPTPLLTERVERRVRGGYLGRWLVREVVERPMQVFVHDCRTNTIYCHPAMAHAVRAIVDGVNPGGPDLGH